MGGQGAIQVRRRQEMQAAWTCQAAVCQIQGSVYGSGLRQVLLSRKAAAEGLNLGVPGLFSLAGSRNPLERNGPEQPRASGSLGSRNLDGRQGLIFIPLEGRKPPRAVVVGHADLLVHPRPVIGVQRRHRIVVTAVASAVGKAVEPVNAAAALTAEQSAAAAISAAGVAVSARGVARVAGIAAAGWCSRLASGCLGNTAIASHHVGSGRQQARHHHRRQHACPHRCSPLRCALARHCSCRRNGQLSSWNYWQHRQGRQGYSILSIATLASCLACPAYRLLHARVIASTMRP